MALFSGINLGVTAQHGTVNRMTTDWPEVLRDLGGQPGRTRNPNPVPADGRSRAALTIQLPANAIVDDYDLTLTATRADYVKAAEAADLRVADGADKVLVVDFGTMVTVNAIRLASTPGSISVYAWLGTKFDTSAITPSGTSSGPPYLFSMAAPMSNEPSSVPASAS